jgi:hypothetical protein
MFGRIDFFGSGCRRRGTPRSGTGSAFPSPFAAGAETADKGKSQYNRQEPFHCFSHIDPLLIADEIWDFYDKVLSSTYHPFTAPTVMPEMKYF